MARIVSIAYDDRVADLYRRTFESEELLGRENHKAFFFGEIADARHSFLSREKADIVLCDCLQLEPFSLSLKAGSFATPTDTSVVSICLGNDAFSKAKGEFGDLNLVGWMGVGGPYYLEVMDHFLKVLTVLERGGAGFPCAPQAFKQAYAQTTFPKLPFRTPLRVREISGVGDGLFPAPGA